MTIAHEEIVAVAMRDAQTHLIYSLPRPKRHHDIGIALVQLGHPWPITKGKVQGFITSAGRFVSRAEALQIAKAAGQLLPNEPVDSKYLFSENVW